MKSLSMSDLHYFNMLFYFLHSPDVRARRGGQLRICRGLRLLHHQWPRGWTRRLCFCRWSGGDQRCRRCCWRAQPVDIIHPWQVTDVTHRQILCSLCVRQPHQDCLWVGSLHHCCLHWGHTQLFVLFIHLFSCKCRCCDFKHRRTLTKSTKTS